MGKSKAPVVTKGELYRGKDSRWRFRGRAANGLIVLRSDEPNGHVRRDYTGRKLGAATPLAKIYVVDTYDRSTRKYRKVTMTRAEYVEAFGVEG